MPQTSISEDDLRRMRKAVQASRPHTVYKIPACGYSGITRTTSNAIYYQLVRFQFPTQAMQDWNNANALKRSIRDIASSVIEWDTVQGRVPNWSECSKTDQLRMIGKVEDRYSWMKCFESHWLSEVLLGKHVTSKARDIRKASAAEVTVTSTTPSSSLLDSYQSFQSDQSDQSDQDDESNQDDGSETDQDDESDQDEESDNNLGTSQPPEYTKISYAEDDVLTVEDDTDNNTLEEDMDDNSDDRGELPKPRKVSGWTGSTKQNKHNKALSTASTSIASLPASNDCSEKHTLRTRAAIKPMRDNKGKSSVGKNNNIQTKLAKPKKAMHLRKDKDDAQSTTPSSSPSNPANRPPRKRKLSTDTGAVASEETTLSALAAAAKPPKKRVKASANQPIPRPTRECLPSEKASENNRISKDIANKKQAAAEKRQRRATNKAQRQAAESALLAKFGKVGVAKEQDDVDDKVCHFTGLIVDTCATVDANFTCSFIFAVSCYCN